MGIGRKPRDMLIAFAWAAITLTLVGDYYLQYVEMERFRIEGDFVCVYWSGRISPLLSFPLAVAGAFALFGKHRVALTIGVPTLIAAAYQLWGWYERHVEYLRDIERFR